MNVELRQAILGYVNEHDHVTFAELQREFGSRFNMRGEVGLAPERLPTLLYWVGMSREFCAAVNDLTAKRGPLALALCSPMVYILDGATLTLPIATKAHPYKSDHWLPVVIRPRAKYEAEERKGRAKRA
ncbi:MAG: hypothetical protein KF691_07100 [Phycisphaeraceae bacterium]|nr:hypothetical protein [Phycisphaeraceae bacterium]